MKIKKTLVWAALAIMLLLVLSGCSPNQQEIFKAAMRLQSANSLESQTTMTLQLKGSGFDPNTQQQIDKAAEFLNNAKLNLDEKVNSNSQKTAVKAQMDFNLAMPGMNIDLPIWVDTDLTGQTPKINEIFKLPQMASAFLPEQFAGKDYVVLNPADMDNSGLGNLDMSKLVDFSKDFQTAELQFLNSYVQQYNPPFNVIDNGIQFLQTSEGPIPARMYEIKLNDAQFKALIRYTVNNFVQDPEAMNFVKTFMDSSLELSQVPDQAKTLSEFDQAFATFNNNKQLFLTEFNAIMDQLNKVTLLGDQGIDINYAVSEGYIVQESGVIDVEIDAAQIAQLMNAFAGQQNAALEGAQGTLNVLLNFKTNISGINSQPDIQLPQVNASNSFNYADLMDQLVKKSYKPASSLALK